MNVPMTTVTVDQNTAAILQQLKVKADAQGVTLDALLSPLTETEAMKAQTRPLYETATPEELATAFEEWAKSHDPNIPGLTIEDVSRESLYEDRC